MLLEAARERGLRYVQVSTDEVYGSIEQGSFTEESPLNPSSPYSATKAGADLLVASYRHTFGLEALICRGSNNYGPFQYPEKLIPLMVLNALHGDKLPVYGDGMQVRNWIYAEDFARGIGFALEHGVPGEVYNVGQGSCISVGDMLEILRSKSRTRIRVEQDPARMRPSDVTLLWANVDKFQAATGWKPSIAFDRTMADLLEYWRARVGAPAEHLAAPQLASAA